MNYLLDTNICLDLLDTTRHKADETVAWYKRAIEDPKNSFFFFGDAITTIFYVLVERKRLEAQLVVYALRKMMEEIEPLYVNHSDTVTAFNLFEDGLLQDLEDLLLLQTAKRSNIDVIVTRDEALLKLHNYEQIRILAPSKLLATS